MIIGIDARMLGFGYGLGRYVQQLILHLIRLQTTNTYVLFVQRSDALVESGMQQEMRNAPNVRIVFADIPWYGWKEQYALIPLLKKERVDLMHFPHWNIPLLCRGPFVMTIHDLTMFHYPRPEATTWGPIMYWVKDHAHRAVMKSAAHRAAHIFVTSEYTKQDIHATLHVPEQKMTVTYQAPYTICRPDEQENQHILFDRYGIHEPYILYVGAAYPHKNLETLMRAWKIYTETYDTHYDLVLAGKENYFYTRLKQSALVSGLARQPIFTGLVSDHDLAVLYHHANLFVFPSLYEGFGLPPLEALVHGVPVIASERSSLPEVLGEAAVYVDPESPEDIAARMNEVLRNEDIRSLLRENAKHELARYSWDTLARQTAQQYLHLGAVL
ncbi:MAG TPA: hypothetical protein DCY48_03115 [Candidatus Magasanikbacteria bacterium]|nr:MAG: hypothetical protein A3I74_04430 [Candidatus Magasanikbacteria bacterium RIFCSPLOWO2_02_FULL_47_16]OGH79400.1 MAG: hypothetical protein A3C10_04965 [Candidatus Magasanikbacteria bacterium RIFCSPHIGHO2_02_FULL_48_18]OGH83021.1 MAG: hypothetical protein A3G08_01270 [Candidatus Magasanikbacteria bacterium RIFCSPLOWO2_12_FULL_47_9b]HAZ28738.1 hypothetical protein [Candidatus Magasanikbacteria bacterium]